MSRYQIRILLSSLVLAQLVGNFSANLANANETPPAPLQVNSTTNSPLSFVGMTDVGGLRTLQATATLSSSEQASVRLVFPVGTSDRAVKIQVLSRTTIPGSHMTLVSLKVTGIDLWNLSPVDLSTARFLEISEQTLVAKAKPARNAHWQIVPAMPVKGLSAGTLRGYRVLGDGSLLIQFKKSNTFAVTEPTLL